MENHISESLLFLVLFTITFRYLQNYWKEQQIKKNAYPYSVPSFGDVISLLRHYLEVVIFVIKLFVHKKPDWFGPFVGIFITNPQDAEAVLAGQKALGKDMTLYKVVVPFVGQGLISGGVAVWKRDRKLISPSFSLKNTIGYYDIFHTNAYWLADEMRKEVGKNSFNVYHYITNINLRTICETSLGVEKDSKGAKMYPELVETVDRAIEVCTRRLSNIWYFLDITYNFLSISKETKEIVFKYQSLMDYIMEAGKTTHSKERSEDNEKKSNRSKYLLEDLLSLHHDGVRYTQFEVKSHINTVVLAGYETSAATIGFTLVILGIYQDIQEKLYQEVLDTVGLNKDIKYEDLKHLVYMERVIKETLRFFPVAPYLGRIAEEDISLSTKKIAAGSSIVVSIVDLQRDPKVWPNPTKFDPDRFLPEETAKRHPYSWIPFSAGPRNCLGIRYAWISMKLMLTAILQEYHITATYKDVMSIPITMGIILKATEGHLIQITKRNNNNLLFVK